MPLQRQSACHGWDWGVGGSVGARPQRPLGPGPLHAAAPSAGLRAEKRSQETRGGKTTVPQLCVWTLRGPRHPIPKPG